MQEYLKKTIANQRTGANIVGISLDNLDLINFSDDFKTTFETVQGFAKKVDDLNLKNEQEMFRVNLRKRQLEFEQKYAGQDVYNNDDTYKQFMEDYKQLKIQSEEEIQQFKFLTPQEKQIFLKDYQNDYQTDYVKFLDKRNQAEIKKGVNKSIMLIDGIKENLKLEDLSDRTALRKGIDKISSCYDDMIKVGYMDTYTKTIKLADDISETETAMLERQVNEEVIYGTKYTTVEEKKQALKNIQAHLTNPTRINDTVDTIIKTYKLEDTEEIRNYVSGKLKGSYKDMEIKLDKQLYNLDKTQKRLENQAKRAISQENNVRAAINANDTFKLTKLKTGTPYNTVNMLSDDKNIDTLYGDTIENLGRTDDWRIARVLDKTTLGEIRDIKDELDKTNPDKDLNYITAIYRKADELSNGDMEIRNLVIKDASRQLGLDPNITLEYQNNPQILKTAQILKKGKMLDFGFAEGTDLEKGIRTLFDRKSEENYLALFNELGGDEKAYEVLNSYISGYIVTEANEYNRTLEKLPASAFQSILKDKVMFSKIKDDINNVKKLKIYPIQYSYAPIKIENYGINELIFDENIKETETSEEFEDYMFDF